MIYNVWKERFKDKIKLSLKLYVIVLLTSLASLFLQKWLAKVCKTSKTFLLRTQLLLSILWCLWYKKANAYNLKELGFCEKWQWPTSSKKWCKFFVISAFWIAFWMVQAHYNCTYYIKHIKSFLILKKGFYQFCIQAILLCPIHEELIFRGIMLPECMQLTSAPFALLLTSNAFALSHHWSHIYLLNDFMFGLFLGSIYYGTQNIYLPIIAHMAYNGFGLAMLAYYSEQYKISA